MLKISANKKTIDFNFCKRKLTIIEFFIFNIVKSKIFGILLALSCFASFLIPLNCVLSNNNISNLKDLPSYNESMLEDNNNLINKDGTFEGVQGLLIYSPKNKYSQVIYSKKGNSQKVLLNDEQKEEMNNIIKNDGWFTNTYFLGTIHVLKNNNEDIHYTAEITETKTYKDTVLFNIFSLSIFILIIKFLSLAYSEMYLSASGLIDFERKYLVYKRTPLDDVDFSEDEYNRIRKELNIKN